MSLQERREGDARADARPRSPELLPAVGAAVGPVSAATGVGAGDAIIGVSARWRKAGAGASRVESRASSMRRLDRRLVWDAGSSLLTGCHDVLSDRLSGVRDWRGGA